MIELSQFVFEALRKDQEFILYRGQGKGVVSRVLVLSPARQRPLPETAKRLENEYALKEELDPTWATRPLAVAAHWGRTVLVLQDPGGVPLESAFGRLGASADRREGDGLNLALCLRVAINLAATIGALHERGIIHKDIKPANVLADPTSGQCWLTGFGIASRLPRERQTSNSNYIYHGLR